MEDGRIERLAALLVERSLDVQPGWQVVVRATPAAQPLVEAVAGAIARRGAYAITRYNLRSERTPVDLAWAAEAPLELLRELPPFVRREALEDDARLTILSPVDFDALTRLDEERRRALQQAMAPAMERSRAMGVRWAVVQYPTELAAERAGMSLAEYTDFVLDACLQDWEAERERMERIKERLDRADRVRIVGAGTDLTLSIAGREGVVSHGLRNLPDGEVFYCPVEDSAEGVIHYAEFPAIYLGQEVLGARLRFEGGRVVEATADEREDLLRYALDTDDGARRLGELGLGCNERITRHTKNILLDEKIGGTVHLALGGSYTYAGGRNESAIHWDMVKDLRPGGELYADGELIQRDGRWLI